MAMSTWVLGITGGIGSGKSTVASRFAELGIHRVDADQAARWVVEPGRPALQRIVERFGTHLLQDNGQLDRAALRQLIFADPPQRQWLEQLLHPLIAAEISQALTKAQSPYAILESPLLVESGQLRMTQRLLVVDSPEALQIERTMQRDGAAREQVQAIMAAQAAREERLRHAHEVICNDRDLSWLDQQVRQLHAFYLNLRGGQT